MQRAKILIYNQRVCLALVEATKQKSEHQLNIKKEKEKTPGITRDKLRNHCRGQVAEFMRTSHHSCGCWSLLH
jgi:hypothetical protein